MKGSPAKLGTIKGTSGHASALKDMKTGSYEQSFEKAAPVKDQKSNTQSNDKRLHRGGDHTWESHGGPAKMKSPNKHVGKHPATKDGHTHKGQKLFQRVHGALTGTKGKKFEDTKLGKDIAGKKKEVVTKTVDKRLEKKDEANVPATNLKVHKSSSGSGATKPASRKPKKYTAAGNPNETFVRGGGDPYQYQTKDSGKTFQYKKIGESKWNDVRGGNDKISSAYTASTNKEK